MPPLAATRAGKDVLILQRPIHFSFWPMYRTTRRYGVQAQLYATNAWALIHSAVSAHCPAGSRSEAQAYISQAEFFYDAQQRSAEWAAKPLLLYYSFLNLAKAYALTKGVRSTMDQARHGISERLGTGRKELSDAYLEVHASLPSGRPNVFADFWRAMSGHTVTGVLRLDVPYILPQILAGHRIWCDATNAAERFISLEDIRILQAKGSRELWLVLRIHNGTLSQHGIGLAALMRGSQLSGTFRPVTGYQDTAANEYMHQFEQITPTIYTHRAADKIHELVQVIRHRLWAAANATRPFREYYLYNAPAAERLQVLPQLLSIYALAFYLGSITRYRPQHFDNILGSSFGGFLQEFLTSQPTQFLYLLASDFAKRDITRPPLV